MTEYVFSVVASRCPFSDNDEDDQRLVEAARPFDSR